MIRWIRNRSLFQQFSILMILVLLLPLVTMTGYFYYNATNRITGLVSELEQKVVTEVSRRLDEVILNYNTLTLHLANSTELRTFVEQPEDAYYQKVEFASWIGSETPFQQLLLLSPIANNLRIVGHSGIYYATDAGGQPLEGGSQVESMLNRAPYLEERYAQNKGTKLVASQLVKRGENEAFYISIGRVIFGRNEYSVKGVLFTDVSLEGLFTTWQSSDLNKGHFWITDSAGQILYHPDRSQVGRVADPSLAAAILKQSNGTFRSDDSVNVFDTSEYSGWRIIATLPVPDYDTPINEVRNTFWMLALTVLPVTLVAGFFFIRSLLRPIRHLMGGMRNIEREQWRMLPEVRSTNEIGNLILGYNRMVERISTLIEDVYKAELRNQEEVIARQSAEFASLQMQINPHFLYNTLGTIGNYAMISGHEAIEEMIEALAHMFRYSVKQLEDLVPLQLEIEHVQNYLLIQKHRQARMPAIEWETSPYEECLVPRLVLQPIVENAFQHAFSPIRDEHRLLIRAGIQVNEQGEQLLIQVSDNGQGFRWPVPDALFVDELSEIDLGIGLRNVHGRLRLKFGDNCGVTIQSNAAAGVTVTLRLPIRHTTDSPRSETGEP